MDLVWNFGHFTTHRSPLFGIQNLYSRRLEFSPEVQRLISYKVSCMHNMFASSQKSYSPCSALGHNRIKWFSLPSLATSTPESTKAQLSKCFFSRFISSHALLIRFTTNLRFAHLPNTPFLTGSGQSRFSASDSSSS